MSRNIWSHEIVSDLPERQFQLSERGWGRGCQKPAKLGRGVNGGDQCRVASFRVGA